VLIDAHFAAPFGQRAIDNKGGSVIMGNKAGRNLLAARQSSLCVLMAMQPLTGFIVRHLIPRRVIVRSALLCTLAAHRKGNSNRKVTRMMARYTARKR